MTAPASASPIAATLEISPATVRFDSDRRLARLGLLLYLLPTLYFFRTDLALLARGFALVDLRMGLRATGLAALISLIVAVSRAATRERLEAALVTSVWLLAGMMTLLNALRPAGSTLPMRTPMMALLVIYGTLHPRPRHQILAALGFSAALIVLRLTRLTSTVDGDVSGDLVVLTVVNAIGIALTLRRANRELVEDAAWEALRSARDTAEQALSELKTLRGIIPICSHCRQVRTEAGAWQQLEGYIRARTEAEFSHGICPECLVTHYPDLATG